MELTAAEWLALIAERAAELRAAGVRKLTFPANYGAVQLELDAYEGSPAAPSRDPQTVEMVDDADPLNDPATFAMRDGSIPGFKGSKRSDDA